MGYNTEGIIGVKFAAFSLRKHTSEEWWIKIDFAECVTHVFLISDQVHMPVKSVNIMSKYTPYKACGRETMVFLTACPFEMKCKSGENYWANGLLYNWLVFCNQTIINIKILRSGYR